MDRRPTISDVAKLCGVTPATVSRVLNRKQKFSASPAVRERIQKAADRLGYAPDLAARNLNSGRTNIIGVLASPFTHISHRINESLLTGIADSLHAAGYDVFFEFSSHDPDRGLPFWRFDGAVLLQAPKPKAVEELDHRRVPYVCVNEKVGKPVACVLADDSTGVEQAVEHLATLGHKIIAYANAPAYYLNHYSLAERKDGLLRCTKSRSMHLVDGYKEPFEGAFEFLKRAVQANGATGVVAYDHKIAIELVGAAYELGLRIPADFSLICFNDVFPVDVMPPPLTAISVPGRDMGRIGADLLLNTLSAESAQETREIRVPETLVVRASTAPPPLRPTRRP
jgi:DNA-binding LacI/PurR family transcriptional regulator